MAKYAKLFMTHFHEDNIQRLLDDCEKPNKKASSHIPTCQRVVSQKYKSKYTPRQKALSYIGVVPYDCTYKQCCILRAMFYNRNKHSSPKQFSKIIYEDKLTIEQRVKIQHIFDKFGEE